MLMLNGAVSGSMWSDSHRRWRLELATSPPATGSRGQQKRDGEGTRDARGSESGLFFLLGP